MAEQPTGRTRHAELTLDQLAELQPGLADLMPAVGDRYWIAYYAAMGGNWALARYQLRHLAILLRRGAVTRPKHAVNLREYERSSIGPLLEAIQVRDFAAFSRAYSEATMVANRLHVELGHPDIVWRLPDHPPAQLDLGPQPEADPKPKPTPG
ncbi:MAG TPA: hypothetical protein VGD57_02965 [Candidatus Dormibacteraeota bacterium]|jgi:hypothetical protein